MKLVDQTVTLSVTLINNGLKFCDAFTWRLTFFALDGNDEIANFRDVVIQLKVVFGTAADELTREHGSEHRRGHFAVEK